MTQPIGFAGVQMKVRKYGDNLEAMTSWLKAIKRNHPSVEMVLFSELCPYGNRPDLAGPIPGDATDALCQMAKSFDLWLIPGSLYESAAGSGYYNTAPVIDPDGKIVSLYRKMFPWRPREKSLAGDAPCVFEIPGRLRVGVCICYDQWFPEVARQLVWMGADVSLNPTMTTTPDRNLELVLARANAIANQVYFFSVNGVGDGGNGASVLVDPEGEPMAQADDGETVLFAEIDPDLVARVRENGPLGLCQVLKSYRDGGGRFPCHEEGPKAGEGFRRLGPIIDGIPANSV